MLTRFLLSTLLILGIALPARGADSGSSKLDARARAAWGRLRAGDGNLDVFVRGTVTRQALEAAGARVRTALPGLFTASIPPAAVGRVAALDGVTAIRGGAPCTPELNVSVPATGASLLRGAGPEFQGFGGQGVLIGIVDSGIDFSHGDFKDSLGMTRIVSLWDQSVPGTGPPGLPYPYGREWTSAQIDLGSCTQVDALEHGTHIAGVAAGDGSQTGGTTPAYTHAGLAPRADLVVVKTTFTTPDVIDAISYVFDKAAARGQSAVVNLSIGTQFGSHDGWSDFEQGVSLLLGPGRIVVKSAGNDRGLPLHAQLHATPGGVAATLSVSGSATGRLFSVDGYYHASDRLRVQVRTPNGTVIGPMVVKTENAPWPGQSTQNGVVYVVHDSLAHARKNFYLEVYQQTGGQNMNGTWTLTFLADQLGSGNGEVDLWRYLASPGVTANFAAGNLATQELITEPGNAPGVITVGGWVTRRGWTGCNGVATGFPGIPAAGNLAPFSSPGPTRDGRQKPDVTAPGTAVASATSFDIAQSCPAPPTGSDLLADGLNHQMMQGTSIAAPHVTGAVAILLQKFGALTPAQALDYLATRARADAFTGAVPSFDWGYGKLDLDDLFDPVVQVLSPNGGEAVEIGTALTFVWSATDSLGGVSAVDLQLSRNGPGGPWTNVAAGVPNTGTYDWTAEAPATQGHSAFLRVVAHDPNQNTGSDRSDAGFAITSLLDVGGAGASRFALGRPVPNPTRAGARFDYTVGHESWVRLTLSDVQGRRITVLAEGPHRAGRHTVAWNGLREGAPLRAGLYFACLETPEGRITRRIAVSR